METGGDIRAEAASVLVVDDSPSTLMVVRGVIQPLEVRIVEARSGEEALAHAAHEPFAVVLLDVRMPGMDGFEVARRLRETAGGAEVPVIFMTGDIDENAPHRGYASGAADFLAKPVRPEVLYARVKAFVDLFRQRERLRVQQVSERTRERDDALGKLRELLQSERAARREAEMASNAKDEFLSTVSHELRTPLSAILGWSVIARRQHTVPGYLHALAVIERNARAQLRIVEDLLDIGRVTRGKMRLEMSPTRVADAVERAVSSVRPAAEAKQVQLSVEVDANVGVIAADAERLQQVVWNLLSNAIKFTSQGGHVAVIGTRSESGVTIAVRDDGQGIEADLLPFVFEPFRQADASTTRRHGGLGLGLAIVKQLVQAHGGQVSAHSDGVGKGSTFAILLPAMALPGVQPAAVRPPESGETSTRLDGVKLLVVDDDDDSRELIARILSDCGAIVTMASSAEQAMGALASGPPDVLLSDIGMPDMDGYSFIRSVRSLPAAHGGLTPAIALTAYARAEDGRRAFDAGFQAHVTKPIEPSTLLAVVANLAHEGGEVSSGRARP